ncbi:ribosome maturation factor RimM [Xylophilus sp. Kf1]|nr:ribosome maturation factor RimM [Xylophilus sp. Kf1]
MLPGLESAELPHDAIEVGRIVDAWGIKGWFKVQAYSAAPEALFSSKRWFIQSSATAGPAAGKVFRLAIQQAKDHSEYVVATAQDVPDRNAAEALKGAKVFVARSSFPSTAEDEYYWVDLIGLDVVNREGVALGVVRELLSTGPQTVLVMEFEVEGKVHERMIPFVGVYIDKVDLADKRISVDWQPDFDL